MASAVVCEDMASEEDGTKGTQGNSRLSRMELKTRWVEQVQTWNPKKVEVHVQGQHGSRRRHFDFLNFYMLGVHLNQDETRI
jgi:hypothetical protein